MIETPEETRIVPDIPQPGPVDAAAASARVAADIREAQDRVLAEAREAVARRDAVLAPIRSRMQKLELVPSAEVLAEARVAEGVLETLADPDAGPWTTLPGARSPAEDWLRTPVRPRAGGHIMGREGSYQIVRFDPAKARADSRGFISVPQGDFRMTARTAGGPDWDWIALFVSQSFLLAEPATRIEASVFYDWGRGRVSASGGGGLFGELDIRVNRNLFLHNHTTGRQWRDIADLYRYRDHWLTGRAEWVAPQDAWTNATIAGEADAGHYLTVSAILYVQARSTAAPMSATLDSAIRRIDLWHGAA